MKKNIIVLVLPCALIAIALGIFFINRFKTNPINRYPQNECSKKICKNMDNERISGFARLTEENKIEIYVDRNTELDTNTKVDTTTINNLISQVEDPYLCSIRIDKNHHSGIPHIDRIVIANYTPKDLQPYVAPNQLSESDITEQSSHSEHFYYLFTNYFPNNVINSSMPQITNLTISIYYNCYNRDTSDVSKNFEFLKYLPNLEHMKIIHTNGECSFDNSNENIEQLKKITPEGCIIEIEN